MSTTLPPHQKKGGVMHVDRIEAEAFEGGGVWGHAYVPVLESLLEAGANPRMHAGTSAGAIVAFLRALRYPPSEIGRLQESTDWAKWAQIDFSALWRLPFKKGLASTKVPREWLEERLLDLGLRLDLTFRELQEATEHQLCVVATRYAWIDGRPDATPRVFCPVRTPHAVVVDAVLASMAVPGLWPPVQVREHKRASYWYCDGGAGYNHPIDLFHHLPDEKVIGVRVDTSREIEFRRASVEPRRPMLVHAVRALVAMLRREANRAHVDRWHRIVRINVGDLRALEFDLPPEDIEALRKAGRRAWKKWTAPAPRITGGYAYFSQAEVES